MLALLVAGMLAQPLAAQSLLDCRIKGKAAQLSLTLEGGVLTYRYGPQAAPDLVLTRPVEEVTYQPWPGVGATIWEQVTLTNKGVDYSVFDFVERAVQGDEVRLARGAGVDVSRGGQPLARLDCAGTPEADFSAIGEALIAKGYCHAPDGWHLGAGGWFCQ
ncbi:hypothetical protein [Thioclava sp. GXIMD4216]|uniref:hypothetical protein n=1 Tax=Thioclava sp. GXIMD4216 TaxID=3131929 RepID=UPI0030D59911